MNKSIFILCVGPKLSEHRQEVAKLLDNYLNVFPVLDSLDETHAYKGAKAKTSAFELRQAKQTACGVAPPGLV
jgi:hypothetical protein